MAPRKLIKIGFTFLLPHLALVAAFSAVLFQSGETVTVHDLFTNTHSKGPYLFGPKYTSRIYKFKIEGTKWTRPEILAIGSSRMNQWRSAMFKPYSFYNAANSTFSPKADQQLLEAIGSPKPKIVLFSIDFFDLSDNWAPEIMYSLDDVDFGAPPFLKVLEETVTHFESPPFSLKVTDPIYAKPAYGLNAANRGDGFRYDGSYQYGMQIDSYQKTDTWLSAKNLQEDVERVTEGTRPFVFADGFDADRIKDLETFIAYAQRNGITLIGITPPLHPQLLNALNHSTKHKAWKKFNTPAFAHWLGAQGVIYFNFSDIQSIGAHPDEFIDAFHITESGYSRMFLTMMKNPQVKAVFSKVFTAEISKKLSESYPLEVYKNEF